MEITVSKIGGGRDDEAGFDPVLPATEYKNFRIVGETETTFTIEILPDEPAEE